MTKFLWAKDLSLEQKIQIIDIYLGADTIVNACLSTLYDQIKEQAGE